MYSHSSEGTISSTFRAMIFPSVALVTSSSGYVFLAMSFGGGATASMAARSRGFSQIRMPGVRFVMKEVLTTAPFSYVIWAFVTRYVTSAFRTKSVSCGPKRKKSMPRDRYQRTIWA